MAIMPFLSHAQKKKGIEYSGFFDTYYWRGPVSITGGVGMAMYGGDLCSDFTCAKPDMYYTLGLGYKLWPRIYIGGEVNYFGLNSTDKHSTRGYEFTSKNLELGAYFDLYLREDIVRRHNDLIKKTKVVKPYIHLGISAMRTKVTSNAGEISSAKYAPLLPVGFGILFDITPRVHLKVEGVYKIAFSDYLDGVNELANPESNDYYGMMRVKFVYTPKARRLKQRKIKVNAEERAKWSQKTGDSTQTKPVTPKAEEKVDPDADDSYYYENDDEDNSSDGDTDDSYYYEESEGTNEESGEEDTYDDGASDEDSWDGDW